MTEVSRDMTSSLQKVRAALTHNLSKGEAVEETVRAFLRSHLPSSIGITKGQVIDAKGQITKQLDVILFDAARTPIIFRSEEEGHQVVPVEGVIAVVEVKTKFGTSDVEEVVDNMLSVKRLSKSAYFSPSGGVLDTVNLYGQEFNAFPTLYFVFSFEGNDVAALVTEMARVMNAKGLPIDERIDCVCVLDKGVVLNALKDGTFDAVPSPGSALASYNTDNALLLWFVLVSRLVLQAQMPPINLNAYAGPDFVY